MNNMTILTCTGAIGTTDVGCLHVGSEDKGLDASDNCYAAPILAIE